MVSDGVIQWLYSDKWSIGSRYDMNELMDGIYWYSASSKANLTSEALNIGHGNVLNGH